MTVKELKELIANVPDNFEVRFEYTDKFHSQEISARGIIISKAAHAVLLTEGQDNVIQ